MKISKESSGINLVDSENSIIYLNFQGCFTVQLSRFCAVALPRQQNLLYQILFALSTLFFIFFLFLYRVNEYYLIKSIWVCQEFFYFFRVFSTFVLSRTTCRPFFSDVFFNRIRTYFLPFFFIYSSKYWPVDDFTVSWM